MALNPSPPFFAHLILQLYCHLLKEALSDLPNAVKTVLWHYESCLSGTCNVCYIYVIL